MSNVGEIESALFKRVAGGHIFQAPNPWIFGQSSRYLVNDTQKAQLLAIITPRRPVLRGAVIIAGILLWTVVASAIMWAFSGNDEPTGYDVVAMAALILAPMLVALMMALRRNLRRMQPVLAGLPRSDERISHSELRQAMAKAMSFRATMLVGAAWTITLLLQIFILVVRSDRHPLFSDVQSFLSLFMAIIAAGLAAHYLAIAMRKAKSKQTN